MDPKPLDGGATRDDVWFKEYDVPFKYVQDGSFVSLVMDDIYGGVLSGLL